MRERRSGREEQKGEEDRAEEGACRRKGKADVKKWNEWVMKEERKLA